MGWCAQYLQHRLHLCTAEIDLLSFDIVHSLKGVELIGIFLAIAKLATSSKIDFIVGWVPYIPCSISQNFWPLRSICPIQILATRPAIAKLRFILLEELVGNHIDS